MNKYYCAQQVVAIVPSLKECTLFKMEIFKHWTIQNTLFGIAYVDAEVHEKNCFGLEKSELLL